MHNDSAAVRRQLEVTEGERQAFLETCQPPDGNGCIRWGGKLRKGGWGVFKLACRRARVAAHHVAWHLAHGGTPADPELVLDHTCQVRDCVNVAHLEWVTDLENQRRIDLRRRKCRRGRHDWHAQPAFFRFNSRARICFMCEAEGPRVRQYPPGTRPGKRKADRRSTCPRGHDVSGVNGYEVPGLPHMRGCHTCTRAWKG